MEAERHQQTVVPTDRTLEDVLAAGATELNQDAFALAARAAELSATQEGKLPEKYLAFSRELVANCKKFGDSIPRRVVEVFSASAAKQSYLETVGYQLWYAHQGTDGCFYFAYVYP
jgi:hypothetical protein